MHAPSVDGLMLISVNHRLSKIGDEVKVVVRHRLFSLTVAPHRTREIPFKEEGRCISSLTHYREPAK